MSDLLKVDRREVRRYLGIRQDTNDPKLDDLIERAVCRVAAAATPRFIKREMPLKCGEGQALVGDCRFIGNALVDHLNGCNKVLLFAATLGSEVDRLLSRDSITSPSLAVTQQAAAAAMIEVFCDDVCRKLELSYRENGLSFRPRFSPGYADFSLDAQPVILSLLDAQKRIGLTLTDSGMLAPMKSVTAVIGIGTVSQECHACGCATCMHTDCAFRKE